jgi:hypothetical protein
MRIPPLCIQEGVSAFGVSAFNVHADLEGRPSTSGFRDLALGRRKQLARMELRVPLGGLLLTLRNE